MLFWVSLHNKQVKLTPGGAVYLSVMFRVRPLKAKEKRRAAAQH